MKQDLIKDVILGMLPYLNNAQNEKLQEVLRYTLAKYEVTGNQNKEKYSEQNYIELFISAKRIEGCSEKSLKYYKATIEAMLDELQKDVKHIVTDDIRGYLTEYQEKKKSSKVTIDNIRRILSSFFSWLEDEDYILKSPVRRIHRVKTGTNIKETYSDEVLELMRDNCTELRDLAIIDMLASTGMRVGEMVLLNRDDIDFNERECIVFGKGSKERVVYFDARTKIHLQNYLDSRTDDNPALFVSLKSPHKRLKIGGVEVRLRQFGKQLGINKVHPHKFRRTLATVAIDKGMPIEQLQQLLGHRKIDTTLQYAMVKQSNVKIAHRNTLDREENIMAEWITTTLEECTDILGDGLHGTPKYTENGEYAFVNGNNLVDGEILIKKETKRVDYSQYDKYKKPLTNRTILVSINGTLGNVGVYGSEK